MMQFRLRTLLILMGVLPPLLAGFWWLLSTQTEWYVRVFGIPIGLHIWVALAGYAALLAIGIRRWRTTLKHTV
jgi:hypothetical protein